MKYLFAVLMLIFLLATMGCSQTYWGKIVWVHDYQTTLHTPIDSTDLNFNIYYSTTRTGSYQLLDTAPKTPLVLLDTVQCYYPQLYNNQTYYFFLNAHQISTGGIGPVSDTTNGHFFPAAVPTKTQLITLEEIVIPGG